MREGLTHHFLTQDHINKQLGAYFQLRVDLRRMATEVVCALEQRWPPQELYHALAARAMSSVFSTCVDWPFDLWALGRFLGGLASSGAPGVT